MRKRDIVIYTDGSHLKHTTGRLGVGGVMIEKTTNKIIHEFSKEVLVDYLKLTYGTSDVSNPTCEMLAIYWALVEFKKYIKENDIVTFKCDYQGVPAWIAGGDKKNKIPAWKINKPYIQKIKDDIVKQIYKQGLDGRANFEWIRGHQKGNSTDAIWNNYVDLLAKGQS